MKDKIIITYIDEDDARTDVSLSDIIKNIGFEYSIPSEVLKLTSAKEIVKITAKDDIICRSMPIDKIQVLADELWCDLANESDGRQTTMNYKSFIEAMHRVFVVSEIKQKYGEILTTGAKGNVSAKQVERVCNTCYHNFMGHMACITCDELYSRWKKKT